MIFPVVCPVCQAASGRRIIPASPEVEVFRCGHCQHEWSEPATYAPIADPAPLSLREKLRVRLLSQFRA